MSQHDENRRCFWAYRKMHLFFLVLSSLILVCWAPSAQAERAGDDRLSRVQGAGILRVCIWPEYYGISYRDPRTLALSGVDHDMALALGDDLGVAVRFYDSNFARLATDLADDRCDVAMFGIGIIPGRKPLMDFTTPHLQSDIFAVTTLSNRRVREWEDIDREGNIVVVARGTLHETVMAERLRLAELQVVDSPFAREQEVHSGRADVFMTDFPYGQRFMAGARWARLIEPPEPFHISQYAYAVKPGQPVWLERLNVFVEQVKQDGRLAEAAERNHLLPMILGR